MHYDSNTLLHFECLRFGSSIPGNYWGCCAADIMQCFKTDPDLPASIQLTSGDGSAALTVGGQGAYLGPTNKDIFYSRLRIGTFGTRDMPNHAFFAILTDSQIKSAHGKKWLAILKEAGFEFVRSVSNSVYAGAALAPYNAEGKGRSINYIFMLVRNIGAGHIGDAFTPPKEWSDLSSVKLEPWHYISEDERKALTLKQHEADTAIWNKIGPAKFLTEQQVRDAGAPVVTAGVRGGRQPHVKAATATPKTKASPFAATAA